MRKTECFLCGDLADRDGRIELGHGLALAADIAPLTSGHVLLHTRDHVRSFATLGADAIHASREVIACLTNAPPLAGRELLIFEHGADEFEQTSTGCTDHAHIHILPIPINFDGAPVASSVRALLELGIGEIGPPMSFFELDSLGRSSYFWIADRDLALRTITFGVPERQILRRTVAKALSLRDYHTWDLMDIDAAKSATAQWRHAVPVLRDKGM